MSRTAYVLFFAIAGATAFTTSACSSGDVAVGSSDQALQKQKDGTPTGDGKTCSWDDTVSNDPVTGQPTPAPNGGYQVGEKFKAPDGCNDCSCTVQGISCTERACGNSPPGCTEELMQCPDGTSVARTGPRCEFAPCGSVACTEELMQCPDGTSVARTGPRCEFVCPGAQICPADAKQCPDGSSVSRTGPNCSFPACP